MGLKQRYWCSNIERFPADFMFPLSNQEFVTLRSQSETMPPLIPELQVRDISASLRFYLDALGFQIMFDRPESKFAMIALQGSWIILEQAEGFNAVTEEEFVEGRQWRTRALDYPFGHGINFQIAEGLTLYSNRHDKSYSLTDCISMHNMRTRNIMHVLTNDIHFTQEGFDILFRNNEKL
jgi:hypothetical protein